MDKETQKFVDEVKAGAMEAQGKLIDMTNEEFNITIEQTNILIASLKNQLDDPIILVAITIADCSIRMEKARREGKELKFEDIDIIRLSVQDTEELQGLEKLMNVKLRPYMRPTYPSMAN